jgi:hypothetical protein
MRGRVLSRPEILRHEARSFWPPFPIFKKWLRRVQPYLSLQSARNGAKLGRGEEPHDSPQATSRRVERNRKGDGQDKNATEYFHKLLDWAITDGKELRTSIP